jgi:hypothetical protein
MEKKRKIEKVVRKVSLAEAEEADDLYWANASVDERLNTLIELRKIFSGEMRNGTHKIAKVVIKRNLYDEGN